MAKVLAFGLPASRRNVAEISLLPELLPSGAPSANTPKTDRYRSLLSGHGRASIAGVARSMGRHDGRLYREAESLAPLSVDFLVEAGRALPVEDRARVVQDIAARMGLGEVWIRFEMESK